MILWFWLLVGVVITSPITIEIKNAKLFDMPNALIIGEVNNFVSASQIAKIVSRLTAWKSEYFGLKNPQLETKNFSHEIGASFRSVRRKSFSYEELNSDVFFNGEVSKLMQFFSAQIKEDSTMNYIWPNCKIYAFPFVKVTKRIENTNLILELGRIQIKQFFEDQYIRMNSIEDVQNTVSQSSESESASSPELKLTEIYGVLASKSKKQSNELYSFPTNNLREGLLSPTEDDQESRCCCIIS